MTVFYGISYDSKIFCLSTCTVKILSLSYVSVVMKYKVWPEPLSNEYIISLASPLNSTWKYCGFEELSPRNLQSSK